MNELVSAAVSVQSVLQAQGRRSCLIGGLAVARWGEPRATQDVDFSVFVEMGDESEFVASMLEEFPAMFAEPELLARQCRILPLDIRGIKADLSIACFPFEEEVIDRATAFEFESGASLITISAEDLIVMKALAGRPLDWRDVAGIVHRQADVLDRSAVLERARSMSDLTPNAGYLEQLQAIMDSPIDFL